MAYSKRPIPLTADPTLVGALGHTQDAVAQLSRLKTRTFSPSGFVHVRTIAQVIVGVKATSAGLTLVEP